MRTLLLAAALAAMSAADRARAAPPGCGEEVSDGRTAPEPEVEVLAWNVDFDVSVVSNYVFRGISYSDDKPALQTSVTAKAPSGLKAGLFVTTIPRTKGAEVLVDLFASKTFQVERNSVELGAVALVFGDNVLSLARASVSRPIAGVETTLALIYGWKQETLGDEDNLTVSLEGSLPLAEFGGTVLTLDAGVGYVSGPLAIEGAKFDWLLGATADFGGIEIAASYVDTSLESARGRRRLVLSVSRSF